MTRVWIGKSSYSRSSGQVLPDERWQHQRRKRISQAYSTVQVHRSKQRVPLPGDTGTSSSAIMKWNNRTSAYFQKPTTLLMTKQLLSSARPWMELGYRLCCLWSPWWRTLSIGTTSDTWSEIWLDKIQLIGIIPVLDCMDMTKKGQWSPKVCSCAFTYN